MVCLAFFMSLPGTVQADEIKDVTSTQLRDVLKSYQNKHNVLLLVHAGWVTPQTENNLRIMKKAWEKAPKDYVVVSLWFDPLKEKAKRRPLLEALFADINLPGQHLSFKFPNDQPNDDYEQGLFVAKVIQEITGLNGFEVVSNPDCLMIYKDPTKKSTSVACYGPDPR